MEKSKQETWFLNFYRHRRPFEKSLTGFTLVEIMVVIAIIAFLATIGIPGLLRSRMNANETSAIASLKTITTTASTYRTTNSVYPENLSVLGDTNPPYIDTVLAGGKKQGYLFSLKGDELSFNATAQPASPNVTGVRYFFVDTNGIIRASTSGPADASSPAV